MNTTKIKIGTRGSTLALIQAQIIGDKLKKEYPDTEIEIVIIKTEGDRNQNPIPNSTVGKAWFTKEIEKALVENTIDLAVHSLKDLPNESNAELVMSAHCSREDARDVLISKSGQKLNELPRGAVIGTDSLRRKSQVLHLRPDLKVISIRGNVPTRISKLFDGNEYDAIILAKAGLVRLNIQEKITQEFSLEEMLPAPGQGILGVQTRTTGIVMERATILNDKAAQVEAQAERAFSQHIGGGCKTPVGAYAQIRSDKITLYGMVGLPDGTEIWRDSITGDTQNATQLAKNLAGKLISKCSAPLKHLLQNRE